MRISVARTSPCESALLLRIRVTRPADQVTSHIRVASANERIWLVQARFQHKFTFNMSIPIAECDLWVLKLALGSCAADDGAECLDAT